MTTNNIKSISMLSTHGYFDPIPQLGQTDTGGQVVYVLQLAKALAKLGMKVDIYTRWFCVAHAVDARARHENEATDSRRFARFDQRREGIEIDRLPEVRIQLEARVIGDAGEVEHHVDILRGNGEDHPFLRLGDPDLVIPKACILEGNGFEIHLGPGVFAHLPNGRRQYSTRWVTVTRP